MTPDMMAILHLFRIGTRHVERTSAEIAERMQLMPIQSGHMIGILVKTGYLRYREANDPKIRGYGLTDQGKAWLAMQPVQRGRVLTAVPR